MREMGRGTVWCLALLLLGLPPVHTSGEVTQGDLDLGVLKEVKKDMPFPTIIFPKSLIESARLSKPSWTSP